MGSKVRSETHPDSRAILYEELSYKLVCVFWKINYCLICSKKKINDFLSMLEGFRNSSHIIDVFSPYLPRLSSHLLKQIVTLTGDKGTVHLVVILL